MSHVLRGSRIDGRETITARSIATLCLALSGLVGCAPDDSGAEAEGPVAVVGQALGTVFNATNQHLEPLGGSEIASSTMGSNSRLSFGFNGVDPTHVTFSQDTRFVRTGASIMGFSTYNFATFRVEASGRPAPPNGIAVLWGDPAITRNRAVPNSLYLSSLAIPASKMPASGVAVGPIDNGTACGLIGGACIARSTNNGTTFAISPGDCVSRTTASCPNGVFYDGADMDSSPEGRVYAAYRDTTNSRIDVYMATSSTGSFSRVRDLTTGAFHHPRIKFGPDALYLLFMNSSGALTLARYDGGASFNGNWTTVTVEGSAGASSGSSDVKLSDRALRLGPEYDFDTGFRDTGTPELRIVFTLLNSSGKHFVKIVRCTTGASMSCTAPSSWSTATAAGDQFEPSIAAGFNHLTGKPAWFVTFHDRRNSPTGNLVELWTGEVREAGLFTVNLEIGQVPCPDLRCTTNGNAHSSAPRCQPGETPNTKGGYWGDYDRMRGTTATMWRPFSDSKHGACDRKMFTSSPLIPSLAMWRFTN